MGKPNPYIKDMHGKSALHIAASKFDMETFDLLIKSGFDPMITDCEGNTILHLMA